MAYQNEVELYPALQRSSLETPPVHVYLPMIREERRPPSGLLGLGLEHSEHGVCEGSAAFGCLAELATRRGSPLRPAGARATGGPPVVPLLAPAAHPRAG